MSIDNTDTEWLIRDMVMGKKSYLFCQDLDACRRAAMMYSLFGACKVLYKILSVGGSQTGEGSQTGGEGLSD